MNPMNINTKAVMSPSNNSQKGGTSPIIMGLPGNNNGLIPPAMNTGMMPSPALSMMPNATNMRNISYNPNQPMQPQPTMMQTPNGLVPIPMNMLLPMQQQQIQQSIMMHNMAQYGVPMHFQSDGKQRADGPICRCSRQTRL